MTAILIKSFKKHFNFLNNLLESINAYNMDKLPVYLIISKDEYKEFRRMFNYCTDVFFEEDLILPKFTKSKCYKDNKAYYFLRKWKYHNLVIRKLCYRGTLVQQLCKLALPYYLKGSIDNFIILDSDVVFLREFHEREFVSNGKPELIETKAYWIETAPMEMWTIDTKRLLGIENHRPEFLNWIEHGTCWNSTIIKDLLDYIQEIHGMHWQEILINYPFFSKFQDHGFFSELQLYGIFHKYLSKTKQCIVSNPKTFNIWNKIEFECLINKTDEEIKNILSQYLLIGIQKEYLSLRERNKSLRRILNVVNSEKGIS